MSDPKTPKKPSPPSAGVYLEGKTAEDFKTIKDKIEKATPGIRPKNADVIRYALHLAANGAPSV